MASIGSALASAGNTDSTTPTSSSSSSATNPLADESTFLQLLVTQIQNQDPTQPMDSTAFLSELAQFSQLEQLATINQDLQTGVPVYPETQPSSTTPTGSTTAS
jgi:flagellar basal-body rod modification protein FlgD